MAHIILVVQSSIVKTDRSEPQASTYEERLTKDDRFDMISGFDASFRVMKVKEH